MLMCCMDVVFAQASMQEQQQRQEHMAKVARKFGAPDSQHSSRAETLQEKRTSSGTLQKPKPVITLPAQPEEALEIVLPDDVTVRQLALLLGE